MGWKCTTQNGHMLSDVISALQKTIRRGDEQQAMYWALECIPKYELYLWRRLNVITQEDIGIANVEALILVPSQEEQYFRFRAEGRDGTARLILANTILTLCRSTKTRLADHFQCAVHQGMLRGTLQYDIPDYALDKHTGRGRQMGRGLEHWREEGCLLIPQSAADDDPYEDTAFEYWADFIKTNWGKRSPDSRLRGYQDDGNDGAGSGSDDSQSDQAQLALM